MKKFFKKLFCKHEWKYVRSYVETCKEPDFSGGFEICWTDKYDVYQCTKCGRTKKVLSDVIYD